MGRRREVGGRGKQEKRKERDEEGLGRVFCFQMTSYCNTHVKTVTTSFLSRASDLVTGRDCYISCPTHPRKYFLHVHHNLASIKEPFKY